MSILDYYEQKLAEKLIEPDPLQRETVLLLQQIERDLEQPKTSQMVASPQTGFFSRLLSRKSNERSDRSGQIRGVYLWGGVGRGKTWLMDQFYKQVAIEEKERLHFNRFMLDLHEELKKYGDQENPLELIAKKKASEVRLLCLDELHLTEITNAVLLYPMLENLIREGVVIIATSNRHPEELYQGSFHADRFIEPTRYLMEQLNVVHLDNGLDYRVRRTEKAMGVGTKVYGRAAECMTDCFDKLAKGNVREAHTVQIGGRDVQVRKSSDNVIWFNFSELCETNRTTSDYIWLTEHYEVLMVTDIPVMNEGKDPAARRFFYLVDELYDRKVRFIFCAQDSVDKLYQGLRLTFPFKRTLSRLMAMHYGNRLTC